MNINLSKKIFGCLSILLLFIVALSSGRVFAYSPPSYVAGPGLSSLVAGSNSNGATSDWVISAAPQTNGSYTEPVWVLIANPSQNSSDYPAQKCNSPGGYINDSAGNALVRNSSGGTIFNVEGTHSYSLATNQYGDVLYSIDNNPFQVMVGSCTGNLYPPDTVFWQSTVSIDTQSPSVSITSPGNNANLASTDSTITVMGTVHDSGSGIRAVTVNGVNASVSGSTYSASVGINFGLNTVTVVAISNVNSTASTQINVFRYENTASGPGTTGVISSGSASNKPNPSSITKSTSVVPNNLSANSASQNSNSARNNASGSPVSTPVKVAGGVGAAGAVGVATASWLGYIPYKKIGLFVGKFIFK